MWIVRSYFGYLYVSNEKPIRVNKHWWRGNLISYIDNNNQFSDLKWEDEPIEVELVRK